MGAIHDAIEKMLLAEVSRDGRGWDAPPELHFLYVERGEPRLSACELEPQFWAQAPRPPMVLVAMGRRSEAFAPLLQMAAPPGLFGMAFLCEIYMVRTEPGASAETRRRNDADHRAHRLHTRPDAVEMRALFAVDRGGVSYQATVERGTGKRESCVWFPKPGGPGFTGDIPESLDKIVQAMTGVTLPERPDPAGVPGWPS